MRHSTADQRVPPPTEPGCSPPPLVHRPQGPTRGVPPLPTAPVPVRIPAGPIRHAGGCLQPVLLRGRVDHVDDSTGELIHRYTTVHEPGGLLPVPCKTRRASRCAPCAEVYRAYTYQLIRAGPTGGKGVPAEVANHPCVFVTLTAPSFGPVHARRERGDRVLACRPRRNGRTCRMVSGCPATRSMPMTMTGSASRCAPSATTTRARSCSTPTPPNCGDGSPSRSAARSPAGQG